MNRKNASLFTLPQKLRTACPPHVASGVSVRSLMLDVMIALLPALGVSIYFSGLRALLLVLVCMGCCAGFELLYQLLMKKPVRLADLSACVTGMLLAMTLPVSAPYWMAAIGCFFAIVVVKQLYGGLGKNFMNPALAGRVFLLSFPALMNTWSTVAVDAVTSATALVSLKQGILPASSLSELLIGANGGSLGEVSAIALLLGGLYLILRKTISPRIPVAFLGTVAALTYLFPRGGNEPLEWMCCCLLSGGLLLGAIFMATDPVTSPVTPVGQLLYGVGGGALTVFLRYFGAYPEGVGFAILIMNALVWLLDKAGMSRRFGSKGGHKA